MHFLPLVCAPLCQRLRLLHQQTESAPGLIDCGCFYSTKYSVPLAPFCRRYLPQLSIWCTCEQFAPPCSRNQTESEVPWQLQVLTDDELQRLLRTGRTTSQCVREHRGRKKSGLIISESCDQTVHTCRINQTVMLVLEISGKLLATITAATITRKSGLGFKYQFFFAVICIEMRSGVFFPLNVCIKSNLNASKLRQSRESVFETHVTLCHGFVNQTEPRRPFGESGSKCQTNKHPARN